MRGTAWTRRAAAVGLLFVAIFATSFFITSTPDSGASAAKISHYYLQHKTTVTVDGLLIYLAVFTGIWFYVYLWRYFSSFDGLAVPAVASLVGAALFAAAGAVSAGLNFALTDHPKALNDGALVALNSLQNNLTYPMTIAGLAAFYVAAGIVIRKGRAFPQWLAWVSWVLAVGALVPPASFIAFVGTPIWVLIVSVMLWRMPVRIVDATAESRISSTVPVKV